MYHRFAYTYICQVKILKLAYGFTIAEDELKVGVHWQKVWVSFFAVTVGKEEHD